MARGLFSRRYALKKKYDYNKENGLCVICSEPTDELMCLTHKKINRKRVKKYRRLKKVRLNAAIS